MKKFYSILVVAIVALCSFAAQAMEVTLNLDSAEVVVVEVGYGDTIQVATGANTLNVDLYTALKITPVKGYALKSVTVNHPSSYTSFYETGSTIYFYEDAPATVDVVTYNPDDARTGEALVVLDNAADIVVLRGFESWPEPVVEGLVDGNNVIKYNPETEAQLKFYRKSNRNLPLFKVTADTTPIAVGYNNNYIVALPVEGVIDVKANFPDENRTITLDLTEAPEGLISSITVDGDTVDFSNGSFEAKLGSEFALSYDYNTYNVDQFYVNGSQAYIISPYRAYVYDNMTLKFVAHKYAQYNVTLTVDNPSYVEVRNGSTWSGTILENLVAGDNKLVVAESNNTLAFSKKDGAAIDGVYLNGTAVEQGWSGYEVKVADGDSLSVVTRPIVADQTFVIYVDSLGSHMADFSVRDDNFVYYHNPYGEEKMHNGYNTIMFDASYAPFTIAGFYELVGTLVAYIDGEKQSQDAYSYQVTPNNNTVMKIFSKGEPARHDISFEVVGENVGEVKVYTDLVQEVADLGAILNLHEGTDVRVAAADEYTVSVNEAPVAKVDGFFQFNVAGASAVKIAGPVSGVEGVSVAPAANDAIYNLQGIRVANPTKGLYIQGGRKVIL